MMPVYFDDKSKESRYGRRAAPTLRSVKGRGCPARAYRRPIKALVLKKTFLSLGLCFGSLLLHAQLIHLSYDKKQILLGEQMGVEVKAFVDKGGASDPFPLDSLPHFEVLEKSPVDTVTSGTTLQLTQMLIVTSWDSGRWQLPTVIAAGQPSKPVSISVSYTSPWNPRQPYHDIKGIAPVKAPGKASWWWYLIGLAVMVALFLLFFPKSKKEKTATALDKNAYKKALEQLAKLEKEKTDSAKVFYTELINIFREYLKGGRGIQSFSKTTGDLSIQLQSQALPPPDYNQLVQTLRLSDLVKFAAFQPDASLNHTSLSTIKQAITQLEHHHAV